MARALTKTARQELVRAVRERYQTCSRDAKSRILEEFASVSGYHRKSAIRILNGATCPEEDERGRRRPRIYDEAARQALIVLWEASDRVCGKRLKALRIVKRYHAPETPASRLLNADTVSSQVKARLEEIASRLDPPQLLDEIRRVQHHIVRIGDGENSHAVLPQRDDLSRFLASLSTAWHAGEVRPTHRSTAKPPRHWRTRVDPFESGWSQVREWLEVDPDLTGLELFERLQRQRPGVYPDGQLRTLQRRLKHWRMGMARSLIFGVHGGANKELLPPSAADHASIDSASDLRGEPERYQALMR
jgi:hypothetical protein